ncbi:hypothetical protein D1P53_000965 [Cryptococcus gattii VGV]|nr:hypothetical protein D1P53_000965 [Cryptococcus gattii VGV]
MFITNITLKDVLQAQERRYSDGAHFILHRLQNRVPFRNTGLKITIPETYTPWFQNMKRGGLTPHFGAPHHPVHWKCEVCEREREGYANFPQGEAAESPRSYYTATTEPLAEDEQVEEGEQVQIVYPVPLPLPAGLDIKARPRTPYVPGQALCQTDYFGTRATWLSEAGYCDANGHAVATSARCEARRIGKDSMQLETTTPPPTKSPGIESLPRIPLPTNQSSWPAEYDVIFLEDISSLSESTSYYSSNTSASLGPREGTKGNREVANQEWEHFKARVSVQMDRDVRQREKRCDEWIKGGYVGHPDFQLGTQIPMELREIPVEMSRGDYVYASGDHSHGSRFGDGYGIGSDSTVPEWTHDSDTSVTSSSQSPPSLLPPAAYSVDQLVHPNDSVSRYGSPDDFDALPIPSPPPAPRGSPRGSPSSVAAEARGSVPIFDFDEVMEDVMDNFWASEDVRWVFREKYVA